jgi:hypothetical protein
LDGTLAFYDKWRGSDHIGEPVPAMLERVRALLSVGTEVKIFTARVSPAAIALNNDTLENVLRPIQEWCKKHVGCVLPVTHEKDMAMLILYDDRAKQVVPNTGELVELLAEGLALDCATLRKKVKDLEKVLEDLGAVKVSGKYQARLY